MIHWFRGQVSQTPDAVSRDDALKALRQLRRSRLLKPHRDPTPGSANDEYWAIQAGMGTSGMA